MSRDSTVIPFRQPDAIDDPLTELAREGARRMLAQALIAEAVAFVAQWKDLKLPDGRDRVVRHGHGPQRAIQTGVGPIEVRRAKVRDRGDVGATEKICVSACNRDPVFGVIGFQSGPRDGGSTLASLILGSRGWDADCGNDCEGSTRLFFGRQVDQGDLPRTEIVAEGRPESHPVGGDVVFV